MSSRGWPSLTNAEATALVAGKLVAVAGESPKTVEHGARTEREAGMRRPKEIQLMEPSHPCAVRIGPECENIVITNSYLAAPVGVHIRPGARNIQIVNSRLEGAVGLFIEEGSQQTQARGLHVRASRIGIDNGGEFYGPDTIFE